MFVKLTHNTSASDTAGNWKIWTETIRDLLNGTITATSGLNTNCFNTGACEITGSKPTTNAGDDTFDNFNVSTNTGSNNDNFVKFDFNHPEQTGTYHYKRRILLYVTAGGTYGLRFRVGNANEDHLWPVDSTSSYTMTTGSNQDYDPDFGNETTFIWANKNCFVIQIANGTDMHTIGSFSHAANAGNEFMYDMHTDAAGEHGPFIEIGSFMQVTRWGTQVQENTTYDRFGVGTNTYMSPTQASITNRHTNYASNYSAGGTISQDNHYMSLFPSPYRHMYPIRTATDYIHQLVPVYIEPHMNDDAESYPFNARLNSLYRTTDDIGSAGSSITYDGTTYAVWMPWKSGDFSGNNYNRANTCFLIPKTVGGN